MKRSRIFWLGWRTAVFLGVAIVCTISLFFFRPLAFESVITSLDLWAAGFESREVHLGPHRVHYYVGGNGPPLVLVHGLGGQATRWSAVMPALASQARVYAIDLVGSGDSDKPADASYSIAMHAETLRQFFDSQQLDRASLAGWSMGAWISAKFTSQWPQRVERLVLIASAGMRVEPDFPVHYLYPANETELQALWDIMGESVPPAFIQRDILRAIQPDRWIQQRTVESMMTGADVLDGQLAGVTMPVLLLWGGRDRLTPKAIADSMRMEMPHARFVEVPECGHLLPAQCADQVLPHLLQFLASTSYGNP